MKKLVKLFRDPALFFQDAARNRRAASAKPTGTPTYVVGFSTWKQYMRKFFPDRNLTFLPREISEHEFNLVWSKKILSERDAEIFIWGFKAPPYILQFIKKNNVKVMFVEDGFVRSVQLGASKAPPMSLCLDSRTPYFNAREASDLELMLQKHDFAADSALLERADKAIELLLNSGVSKYNHAGQVDVAKLYGPKNAKRVLVIGQVEDDASIEFGCEQDISNNDVVRLAAQENPGAQIIYKPHPDVLAGHREMRSNPDDVASVALILRDKLALAQALETVDHVYTITSLAGFEALLRGIKVTTLGAPFYAGWGLTDDRQPTARRQRKLALRELFAGAYLLYPRYFDSTNGDERQLEDIIALIASETTAVANAQVLSSSIENVSDVEKSPDIDEIVSGLVPTYLVGDDLPYRNLMESWFDKRSFIHIPANTTEAQFIAKFKKPLSAKRDAEFFICGANVPPYLLKYILSSGKPFSYLSDGYLRSVGIAGSTEAPCSLLLDGRAPHYDARRVSDLEHILNTYDFEADTVLMERAVNLQASLLQSRLNKYNHVAPIKDLDGLYGAKDRPRVLVLGQVEGTVAFKLSNPRGYTNNDMVLIAAMENPGAHIIFKPHPNVLNKLQVTASNPAKIVHLCQVLDRDLPLSQALETIDKVYTISSLGGFEALLRGIPTTTLGLPFYAGWGLGDDRQSLPRRQRDLTVQQVFAAAFVLYPVYVDPLYKMVVTAERVISSLQKSLKRKALEVTAILPVAEQEENRNVASSPVATYVLGDLAYKSLLRTCFDDRKFFHIPDSTSAEEFVEKFKKNIQTSKNAEFFVVGDECAPRLRKHVLPLGKKIKYLNDGFLRSIDLKNKRTAPYSVLLDSLTPHYDASKPSHLEAILGSFDFESDRQLSTRADLLIREMIASGISKYNEAHDVADLTAVYGEKTSHRILVVGQVEQSVSLKYSNPREYTNNDLIRIAANENPHAQIIFKPHPDVLNKHIKTASDPKILAHLCQILDVDLPLSQSLETIDQVYTISSLAGFEALLRGIKTTVLGTPFYSGWGVADDRELIPRRQRKLAVRDVFAAAYILYPTYIDPLYKTKITPEEALGKLIKDKSNFVSKGSVAVFPAAPKVVLSKNKKDIRSIRVLPGIDDLSKPRAFLFGFGQNKLGFYAEQFSNYNVYSLDCVVSKQVLLTSREIIDFFQPLSGDIFVVWGKKDGDQGLENELIAAGIKIARIEDAFIRSVDLGGLNSTPLSYVFDQAGIYFDAGTPSVLEDILNTYDFKSDHALMERARACISHMLSTGTSKYNHASRVDIHKVYGEKVGKRVLVLGQVEDDASIQFGCAKKVTNNDLVILARLENPDAHIIYKPHPDVLSGARKRYSDPTLVESIAQVMYDPISIADAFETIDHVYTITSLSGFEALLRGIHVTTYGCPFYSGWGLTDERQKNPRRLRNLSVEEIFAGAYILYSTYVNPFTKEKIQIEKALELLGWMKKSGVQPISPQGNMDDSKSQRAKTANLLAKGETHSALVSANIAVGAYGDVESYLSRAKTKIAAGVIGNAVNSDFEYACTISQWKNKNVLVDYAKYLWEFEGYDKKLHHIINVISALQELSDVDRILIAAILCDGGYITKAKKMLGDLIGEVIANPSGYLKLYSILCEENVDRSMDEAEFNLLSDIESGTEKFEELILSNAHDFCVVGNSPVEIGTGNGEKIDAYSQVIRFNAYDVGHPYAVDYGSKATVWVRMPKNMGVPDGRRKNIELLLVSGPNWVGRLVDGVETFSRLRNQFNAVGVIPFPIYVKLVRETGSAPSAGLQILYWIYSLIGTIPRSQVYGFELTDQLPGRNLQYRAGKISVVRHDWVKEKIVFDKIIGK